MAAVRNIFAKKRIAGVGGVLWEYALQECRDLGIDLNRDYFGQPEYLLDEIGRMRKKYGYRQSKSSQLMGRTERQSFYYALQHHAEKLGY